MLLLQQNRRYQGLCLSQASLRPCAALSELLFTPNEIPGTAEGPMPSGSGYDHLSNISSELDRSGVDAGFAQAQDYRDDDPEAVQPPQPAEGPRVTFAVSGSGSRFVRELEDDEEDFHDPIGEAPVIDKLSIV